MPTKNKLNVLTSWDWEPMRFEWNGRIYETNLSKAEFFQLCRKFYLSGYEMVKKILDDGCRELKFNYNVVVNLIKNDEIQYSPLDGGNNYSIHSNSTD